MAKSAAAIVASTRKLPSVEYVESVYSWYWTMSIRILLGIHLMEYYCFCLAFSDAGDSCFSLSAKLVLIFCVFLAGIYL